VIVTQRAKKSFNWYNSFESCLARGCHLLQTVYCFCQQRCTYWDN